MIHPDGSIERGRNAIAENRAAIFAQRRYRDSLHPLIITMVRFRGPDVAVVDGRWELTRLRDDSGRPAEPVQGLLTWVAQREGGRWSIAAWRYTIGKTTTNAADAPTIIRN
jgi:uncharacterized protein (TIGR02246 family)